MAGEIDGFHLYFCVSGAIQTGVAAIDGIAYKFSERGAPLVVTMGNEYFSFLLKGGIVMALLISGMELV